MAKIVHALKSLDIGGTTKTAQLFCEYLATYTDHEVILLYKEDGDISRLPLFLQHIECIPFQDEQGCNNRLTALKPDIVHVYRSGFPEWPHPSPQYKFVETNVFAMHDTNMHLTKTLYMSKWLHDYAKSHLASISRGIGNWSTRFDYVNNPIKKPAHDRSMRLDRSRDTVWLGRCGRPDNGIYDSINVKAAWMLRGEGHDVRFLVMAPPSNMVDDLEQYDIPFQIVEPTVDEDKLTEFYNSVDIYAHARADGESFGCCVAEGMYHGLPVVTHIAVPSHPGMGVFQSQTTLVTDGEDGFVCQHDVAAYTDALRTLVNDSKRRLAMGQKAYDTARQRFDWRIAGAKLVSIYQEILT